MDKDETLVILQFWKRYIDDGRFIIDINEDMMSISQISIFIQHFITNLNIIYPSNIKLECKFGKKLTFLDTWTKINTLNQHITNKLHEKILSKHMYLHNNSNNPDDHKFSIFISTFFRGICLNDNYADFYEFRIKFISRMTDRGYHPAEIRKILKLKNIPKYYRRQSYLDRSWKKLQSKRALKLIYYNAFILNQFDQDQLNSLNDKIIEPEDSELEIIYFIKTYQRLFDDDKLYRSIFREMQDLLPLELKENIRFRICNKIGNKIRKFLN